MSLWQDANCGYVHVFVTTEFPGRTKAVAIEPMNGPANAFNSGDGFRWLPPGERFAMTWGMSASLNRERRAGFPIEFPIRGVLVDHGL